MANTNKKKETKKSSNSSLKEVNNKTTDKKSQKGTLIKFKVLAIKLVLAVLFGYVIFGWIFGIKRMDCSNMNPHLKDGDLLFYYRLEKNYKIGDVVIVKKNNKEYVLRIVAAGSQTVDINDKNNFIVDNYLEIYDVYYKTSKPEPSKVKYPYKLSADEYFVLADYRLTMEDSRTFGPITKKDIKGKIISRLQVRGF